MLFTWMQLKITTQRNFSNWPPFQCSSYQSLMLCRLLSHSEKASNLNETSKQTFWSQPSKQTFRSQIMLTLMNPN